ncbi:hypothetical protein ACI3KS_05225 [Microbacterium sp. ZW T5_45]|uniref:hypothetical protein n=1 Tax=Microbacterium sp. ZW T5_45 TaxID=3378080 RepID=UPI0038539F95
MTTETDPRAYIAGGRRLAVEASQSLDNWWVGVSPRNGYGALVEGSWDDWVILAKKILAADAEHRGGQPTTWSTAVEREALAAQMEHEPDWSTAKTGEPMRCSCGENIPEPTWEALYMHRADAVLTAGFRRTEAPEPSRPPVYLAADLWQALGAPTSDFDAYYERNGWADTWSNVLGVVRDRFRPKCGQATDGEACVLTAGHLPPHYGSSDVGSSERVPIPEPLGEPSDAEVIAVKDGVSRLAGMQLMRRYSSFGDPWWDALYSGIARIALRVIGGVR